MPRADVLRDLMSSGDVLMEETPDITTLLAELRAGVPGRRQAQENLFRLVQAELHAIADNHFKREQRPDPILQPTLLVHEAFQRLIGGARVDPSNRAEFFGFAARVI